MATTNTLPDQTHPAPHHAALLVSLAPLPHDALDLCLQHLDAAFPGESLLVALPEPNSLRAPVGSLRIVHHTPSIPPAAHWTLTAADFLNAHELAVQHQAAAVLQLGADAHSIQPAALRRLADAVVEGGADLALPHYDLPARAGLVNSAILYPVTRALFGTHARFPLAIDLCFSARMAERLATVAQRSTAVNQPDALVWPVAEASVAGFKIAEIEFGPRVLPQPGAADLNTLLAMVTGSLFADVDAKAAFWQRARVAQANPPFANNADPSFASDQVQTMIEAFHLAYSNLHEIWSLVLPPQSLLGLKRLSVLPPASFQMSDSLWARIVYDFLLAFRLRTINRGHLLGALTPLYLAWVASHILISSAGTSPEQHIQALASAFEADKPYLVSRWRWPDRFNP